jgi:coenzyme F420 biosynthesis associated uncharacterized protein
VSSTEQLEPVAWDVAERVARNALHYLGPIEPAVTAELSAQFDAITQRAQGLVEEATGLVSSAGPARAIVVDRFGWVEANIASFRRLLRPLSERLAHESRRIRRSLTPMSRAAAGVEVGLLLAWMSGRVLGQYDVLPGDGSEGGDAVYFVGSNVLSLEARHGFAPDQFRMWIALHETTHRVQFTGVDWMRQYFLDLVDRGTSLVMPDAHFVLDRLRESVRALRAGENPLAEGGVVALFASSEQLATLRDAQGLMSLLEGHSTVVMSQAAPLLVPSADQFAAVLSDRRTSATGVSRVVQQALGVEAKLRQYAEGEHFVRAVTAAGGPELFAEVWRESANLPTVEEIRDPDLWVARVGERTGRRR